MVPFDHFLSLLPTEWSDGAPRSGHSGQFGRCENHRTAQGRLRPHNKGKTLTLTSQQR